MLDTDGSVGTHENVSETPPEDQRWSVWWSDLPTQEPVECARGTFDEMVALCDSLCAQYRFPTCVGMKDPHGHWWKP
jgi:hypothetical protein